MTMLVDQQTLQELQASTIGVSMRQKRFGNSKKLDERIHQRASDAIRANPKWLKTKEIVLHTEHPAYNAVLAFMRSVRKEFQETTVAYPEPTIRLMRMDKLEDFQAHMQQVQNHLAELIEEMDACRDELIRMAKDALRDAFNPNHYPDSFAGYFSIEVTYPKLEPDDRLMQLNPELYQRQVERFRAMMDTAIQETSLALAEELETVFSSLAKSLESGRQIKPNAFNRLNAMLERFEHIRIGTAPNIQAVVDQAREILHGRSSLELERSASARTAVANALAPLQSMVTEFTESIEGRCIEL